MVDTPYRSGPVGLHENEICVLVALVRIMVGLDRRFSEGEADSIGAIALEVGEDSFWTHMRASYESELTLHEVMALAAAVERQEAHETIYGSLFELAANGGIEPEEGGLLRRLAQLWKLEVEVPSAT